jgi:hypothetical protein
VQRSAMNSNCGCHASAVSASSEPQLAEVIHGEMEFDKVTRLAPSGNQLALPAPVARPADQKEPSDGGAPGPFPPISVHLGAPP